MILTNIIKLNKDIVRHIYSYLPIINKDIRKINKNIREFKSSIYYSLLYMYNQLHVGDSYLNWLINDVERWMNNDIPLMSQLSDKYVDIMKRAIYLSYLSDNEQVSIVDISSKWEYLDSTPEYKFDLIISTLTLIECLNLYKFIYNILYHRSLSYISIE